ncbi:hypothetical protein MKP08_12700 [Erythrobacter sp. LQ02-29]|uniref:hypothetical protein n=1 Tax=Erythrobacter sp. LQ02-29 TaxID=2920384 RepID=UPI001F4EA01F|nr:hypothetical protein [Erythrobacter sp. LQ02-29]MCP9223606.1 hypothetical protein [Erythrobacter sp. LQ02-29]
MDGSGGSARKHGKRLARSKPTIRCNNTPRPWQRLRIANHFLFLLEFAAQGQKGPAGTHRRVGNGYERYYRDNGKQGEKGKTNHETTFRS